MKLLEKRMCTQNVTHVIFDLDGTILDTESVYRKAYRKVLLHIKNVISSTSHKKKLCLSVFTSVREFMKIIAGKSCTNTLEWFSPL